MALEKQQSPLYNSHRQSSWASLKTELFQSELISPTDLDSQDIQFSRRLTVYRLMLMLMLVSVGSILIESFLVNPSSPMAVAAITTEFLLVMTLIRLLRNNSILVPPLITLGLNIGIVLVAVGQGFEEQTLWLFPLMIAMAGLMPTSIALVAGLLTLAGLAGSRETTLDPNELAEDAALIATWLISLAVMRLMTRQADELADLALTDPLTGASNRRYLKPQAERNIANYSRYSRMSAMLILDIDHFKKINDEFGHAEGDRVLQALVSLIDQRIRAVDMLFRLGGEEFVVLLSEVGVQTAVKIAEEIRISVSQLDVLPNHPVTVSIGVGDVTQAKTADEWLRIVDEALYAAKNQGRNQVVAVVSETTPEERIASRLPVWR